jgi:RHS repeat-associated protein
VFVTDADNREVLEYDGGSGAILRWYTYGLGANDVLNQTNVAAGTRSTLVPDIQGSIIATLDSGTATLTKASYLPYGESANAPSSFGYTGQRIDPETNGLYYYRARHYSPLLGRFLQTDPLGYSGGSHLYAYVNNDPLNRIDPTGLTWADDAQMFGAWVTGTAPANQVFGPNTNQTQDMMNAPGVNAARDFFYQKNLNNPGDQLQSVTNFAVHFGLSGYVEAGTNSTQQFVGSYSVDITPNSNGTLTFQANNTTSMTSFFYGLWPNSLNPTAGHPMGNYSQTYSWTEPYNPPSTQSSGGDNSVSASGDAGTNIVPGGIGPDQSNFSSGNTGK